MTNQRNFKYPNRPATKKQLVFLTNLIQTMYNGRPTLQQGLLNKARSMSILKAHTSIDTLLKYKPMVAMA